MTPDDWLKFLWLPLLVAVAGGLVVAGVLAFFNQKVRDNFWKPIGRAMRWPFTLRLTTSARQRAIVAEHTKLMEQSAQSARRFKEVCDLLDVTPVRADSTLVPERIQRLQAASADAWAHAKSEIAAAEAHARAQIEARQSLAETQMRDALRNNERQVELARDTAFRDGHSAGRDESEARIEAERAVPLARPAWRVDALRSNETYELRNTQPGVVITDLTMDAAITDFQFNGPKHWPGEFAGMVEFEGERLRSGRSFGVKFGLRWRDANGDWQVGEAWIDKEPIRAIVR